MVPLARLVALIWLVRAADEAAKARIHASLEEALTGAYLSMKVSFP